MKRTSVNPTEWGLQFSMDQGELVEGASRMLHCSGQISVRPDPDAELGVAVVAPGDVRGQMEQALSNIDDILARAGMTRKKIVRLQFFTADIDAYLGNYNVYANWISEAGTRPPQSLIGIQRLILPELLIEIEATAAE